MENLETSYQKWAAEGNKNVITQSRTKEELDNKMINFNNMPYDLRLRADEESIRLFGKTNKERYDEFNSNFLKKDNIETDDAQYADSISTSNESVDIYSNDYYNGIKKSKQWMDESHLIIIIPCGNLDELEKQWTDFNSMYRKKQRESDWKSIELIGMTNEEHYNLLKSQMLKSDIKAYNTINDSDVTTSTNDTYIESELNYINSLDTVLDIDFIRESLDKLSNLSKSQYESILLENAYNRINNDDQIFVNLCEAVKLSSDNKYSKDYEMISPVSFGDVLKPVYIVLVEGKTVFSKIVKKITHGNFSHASISFDSSLNNMYSFNMNTTYGHDGLSKETLSKYPQNNLLGVFTIFVKEKQYNNLKKSINYFLDNENKTKYGFSNLLRMIANIPSSNDFKMVCSQFVDNILKLAQIDITNKDSSLVNPNDFDKVSKKNKKIYIVHYDKVNKYNKNKVNNTISKLIRNNKAKYISESNQINILPYLESKEFPAQFDKDGNLFIKSIKNIKNLDYCNSEFAKSHKLLLQYSKVKNIEGMKYEISKLWYMNNKIEYYMNKNEYNKKMYINVRALILNDFNKYLSEILDTDKSFNFTEYYNNSPFSDDTVKISNNTLKYSIDMIKRIIR